MCALSLGGCISVHSYPETWEPALRPRADACPDLDGTYANTGQSANGTWGATLSGWLKLDPPRPRRAQFDRVDVALSGDELALHAVGADASAARVLDRSRGDFECNEGVLKLSYTESCCFDMMTSRTAGVLSLSRTPTSLVLGVSDVGAAIVIFVPRVYAQHNYLRFERMKDEHASGAAETYAGRPGQ
jgi:hypothetical protein